MVEQPDREVAEQIHHEERPVLLRYGRLGEINIVDDVDPHVTGVVGKVLGEFHGRVRGQLLEVIFVQCRRDRVLAFDSDLVKVSTASVVCERGLLRISRFSCKALVEVLPERSGVA